MNDWGSVDITYSVAQKNKEIRYNHVYTYIYAHACICAWVCTCSRSTALFLTRSALVLKSGFWDISGLPISWQNCNYMQSFRANKTLTFLRRILDDHFFLSSTALHPGGIRSHDPGGDDTTRPCRHSWNCDHCTKVKLIWPGLKKISLPGWPEEFVKISAKM
jgi:hypothetical protein